MFTGIIKHQGIIDGFESSKDGARIQVRTNPLSGLPLEGGEDLIQKIKIGSSVAVNGVCLTAVEIGEDYFVADVMLQTLKMTNLGDYKVGRSVNLETSLCVGDELGGHFVYGHVDGVGEIESIKNEGDSTLMQIRPPESLARYFAPQGSVAIDGISLTIARLENNSIVVSLIPETMNLTNLSDRKTGDRVNLEVDMFTKYLEKLMVNRK